MKAVIPRLFLVFQLFPADERFYVFALRASGLRLISSMRLDDKKNIQSVKSVWSVLHSELKVCVLPPSEGE